MYDFGKEYSRREQLDVEKMPPTLGGLYVGYGELRYSACKRNVLSIFIGCFIVFLLPLIFILAHWFYWEWEKRHAVFYGANSERVKVVFADANLSAANKKIIVADLNSYLKSEWGKEGKLHLYNPKERGNKGEVVGFFHTKRNPRHSGALQFQGDVVATSNGHALLVPLELSDAYANAFRFTDAMKKP